MTTSAAPRRKVPCSCGHGKLAHGDYPHEQPCRECACAAFDWNHVIEAWARMEGLLDDDVPA